MEPLDLLHRTFSEAELAALEQENKLLSSPWLTGVKDWASGSGCFQATKILNALAEKALESRSTTLSELKVLKQNLELHDRIIAVYNSRFFALSCPNHQTVERKIEVRIKTLEQEAFLAQLKKDVERGMPFDRYNVPGWVKRAHTLFNDELPEEFHRLIGLGYITTLYDNVQQERLTMPEIFNHLVSYSPEQLAHGKKQFLNWLETLYEQQIARPIPAEKLIDLIQDHFIDHVVDTLIDEERAPQMRSILKELHRFEMNLNRRVDLAREEAWQETKSVYNGVKDTLPFLRQQIFERFIQTPSFIQPFPRAKLYQEIFDSFPKSCLEQADASAQLHNVLMRKLPKKEAIFNYYFEQTLKAADAMKSIKWLDVYDARKIFDFDQANCGRDLMLGGGTCMALTYRWNKHIQSLADKALTSVSDFAEPDTIEEGSPITHRDRMIQALHSLDRIRSSLVPSRILKLDGMMEQKIFTQALEKPFNEAFQELLDKKDSWPDRQGVMMLSASDESNEGHALGIQIDTERSLYRLWDVNSGLYQFSSLSELHTASASYMEEFYPHLKKFNFFQHVKDPESGQNRTTTGRG